VRVRRPAAKISTPAVGSAGLTPRCRWRDTDRRTMTSQDPVDKPAPLHIEESTTPDLVERWRKSFQAINNGDVEAALSVWGSNPVWDLSPMGLGAYEGLAAIRDFFEGWINTYDEWEIKPEEVLDVGNGVTLAVVSQRGQPAGSSGEVQLRYAAVALWAKGAIVRITNYTDIDEARAVAERLAEERG
jgi:ketosteroid isomerase-like protein